MIISRAVRLRAQTSHANRADYGPDFLRRRDLDSNIPSDKKIWLGWMNDWLYAEEIPTAPWRSSQTFARQLALREINGKADVNAATRLRIWLPAARHPPV
ncbi:hypothetical protein P4S72_24165 [Vibrio sp. PP-XX7]